MDQAERARQIARVLQEALQCSTVPARVAVPLDEGAGSGEGPVAGSCTITRQGGCLACDPGACPVCGYLFTGETIVIEHRLKGKFTLSDRAVHYLSHGISRYQTGYIVRGEPVTVELDLELLAGYLDL